MYRYILLLSCVPSALSACVTYSPDETDRVGIAAEVASRRGGRFTFSQALGVALRTNPRLRADRARVRAADADLAPLIVMGEYRGGREMLEVMADPLALLNLGARGAKNSAFDAEAVAMAVQLAKARWRVAAELAEVFAVQSVLDSLSVPAIDVDPDAYERAGLASRVDAEAVRAAIARSTAESSALRAERERNAAAFRSLVALPASASVSLVPGRLSAVPDRTEATLLKRPDLALALARLRVADAAFRVAVADQYPALAIGPDIGVSAGGLDWMAAVRLPFGAYKKARAAHARREAARAELEVAYLGASREVAELAASVVESADSATAARAELAASASRFAAALTALEVEPDAFAQLAQAAGVVMRHTAVRRRAELEYRRRQNDLDVAYGWPIVTQEVKQ